MSTPYDEMASAFEAHALDGAYNAHYDRPAVLALAGDVRGRRVLDAGCGPGLYAQELVARGAEVVGVDRSEAMLSLARERLGEVARLLPADLDGFARAAPISSGDRRRMSGDWKAARSPLASGVSR